MKRSIRITAFACILVLLTGLFSGCTPGEEKKLRERAQTHVDRLQRHRDVSDSFTLSDEKAEFSSKTEAVPFKVRSETYGENFTVWVSRTDDTTTDDYYCLYLRKEAEDKIGALIEKALEGPMLRASVSFMKAESPALSLHAAGSVEELLKIAVDTGLLIMEVDTVSGEGYNPDEDMVNAMLIALREAGYWCTFYPYISGAVWFEVRPEGFWRVRQTGADGGAMMDRQEYTPTVPAGS